MSGHERFEIDGAARLVVGVPSGRMDIYRLDGAIDVEITGKDPGIDISRTGSTVSITSSKSSGMFFGSVRLRVGVPVGCELELSGASLDVHAEVELGRIRGRTASGDVSLATAESISVRSASGDLRFDRVHGDVDVVMASGDIFGAEVGGALTVSVASGDVRIDSVAGDIGVKSASGDVWIDRATGQDVRVKSMSGTIGIGVAAGTRVNLDLSTLSGDIHRPSGSGESMEPTRTMDLSIRTVSGDIRLSRAD